MNYTAGLTCYIGCNFQSQAAGVCLVGYDKQNDVCILDYIWSTNRPSLNELNAQVKTAANELIVVSNMKPHEKICSEIILTTNSQVFYESFDEYNIKGTKNNTFNWNKSLPKVEEKEAVALVVSCINEGRLTVSNTNILKLIQEDINNLDKQVSPMLGTLALGLGEMEHERLFGGKVSGMLTGAHLLYGAFARMAAGAYY